MANNEFKNEFEYLDTNNVSHSIELKEEDFKLVQVDKSIHDVKFKTKPTTFFKDALKRFRKNKSSVVGAGILGALILGAIILPVAIPFDISDTHPEAQFLEPKLFETGTGFWDGTRTYKNAICDPNAIVGTPGYDDSKYENKEGYFYPAGFNHRAVLDLSEPREGITNQASPFVTGGSVVLVNKNQIVEANVDEEIYAASLYSYYEGINLSLDNEYIITFNIEDNQSDGDYVDAPFTFEFRYNNRFESDETEEGEETSTYLVYDKFDLTEEIINRDEKTFTINLNEVLNSKMEELETPLTEFNNVSFAFNLKANEYGNTSLYLKDFNITSNSSDETLNKTLEKISFKDGNDLLIREKNIIDESTESNEYVPNIGYWSANNNLNYTLHNGKTMVCDFKLDTYENALGFSENFNISEIEMRRYAGYSFGFDSWGNETWHKDDKLPALIEFDFNKLENNDIPGAIASFKVLNEKSSPIIALKEIKLSSEGAGGQTTTFICDVTLHKYYGYGDTMPKFIFGTNKQGRDMLKLTFKGLLFSLLLGFATFIICFSFGLFLGAIEGYYGGWTDMIIQRLTEILSGIPWIVVMTLCILHLGQNFWTFALALCLTGWIGTAGLTRTQFYRFKGREYILASRTLGAGDMRLIFRHILPNSMGTIITSSVLMIPSVIFSEATISYLGLGLKNLESLGVILSDNQPNLSSYPFTLILPAVVIALIMISFNLFGNGLRDAFNPSLKGSE